MIIVLASPLARQVAGIPRGRQAAGPPSREAAGPSSRQAAGLGVDIALAAAGAGARVELVGKVGDDRPGDTVAVELERAGVGHAALLREPAARTPIAGSDAALPLGVADVELALRYLPDFRVIVAADVLPDPVAVVVSDAARYGGAHRVLIGRNTGRNTGDSGDDAGDVTKLDPPEAGDTAFAEFVGRYAALLDVGTVPAEAFATAARDVGWEPARHA